MSDESDSEKQKARQKHCIAVAKAGYEPATELDFDAGWDAALAWCRPLAIAAIKKAKAKKPRKKKAVEPQPVHFQGTRLVIDEKCHQSFLSAFEGMNLEQEYRKMDAWLVSNKRNYRAFGRFADSWLSRCSTNGNGNGNGHQEYKSFRERDAEKNHATIKKVLAEQERENAVE